MSGGLARLLFRLRPEEAIALAFLVPTTYLTIAANLYAREAGVLVGGATPRPQVGTTAAGVGVSHGPGRASVVVARKKR